MAGGINQQYPPMGGGPQSGGGMGWNDAGRMPPKYSHGATYPDGSPVGVGWNDAGRMPKDGKSSGTPWYADAHSFPVFGGGGGGFGGWNPDEMPEGWDRPVQSVMPIGYDDPNSPNYIDYSKGRDTRLGMGGGGWRDGYQHTPPGYLPGGLFGGGRFGGDMRAGGLFGSREQPMTKWGGEEDYPRHHIIYN